MNSKTYPVDVTDNMVLLANEQKLRHEFGPTINSLLAEPNVVEICLNPDGELWCERLGETMQQVGRMDADQAENMMNTIASVRGVVLTRETPILECELPFEGCRFQGLIPPIVARPTFSIRRKANTIFSLDSCVLQGMMSEAHCAAIRAAVDARKNILVVGGTGIGKTTLTNAIIAYMADAWPDDRLVIIEDTGELQCGETKNVVQLRADGKISMVQLLRGSLRIRPHRIIVDEVRDGALAMALIDAWNTGHPGGIATLHAHDALSGLRRIDSLIKMELHAQAELAKLDGEIITDQFNVPFDEIAAAINVVVCIEKTNAGRRVTEVVSIMGHENGKYLVETQQGRA